MSNIVNILLTLFLFILIAAPVVGSHILIGQKEGGTVAGLKTVDASTINILPNIRDFNDYISFNLQPMRDGTIDDTVTFTVFPRQKATYRGLYTLYNMSSEKTLAVKLVVPDVPQGDTYFERISLSLAHNQHMTQLSKPYTAGETQVAVVDTSLFTPYEHVWVASERSEVINVLNAQQLVVAPLDGDYDVGTVVSPELIILTSQGVVNPTTRTITLTPGQQATVEASVWADAYHASETTVSVPLEFVVNPYIETK